MNQNFAAMSVYINGSHTCDSATHMFYHSQWGATSINPPKYPFNIYIGWALYGVCMVAAAHNEIASI